MGPDDMITSLSGGNQQKVIFGKWLEREPQVFMMDEPTRGIDVGAKYEIYELIIKMAKQGKTVIVVSNDISYSRCQALLKNLERFGIRNAYVISESPDKLEHYFDEYFDKILIDALCIILF